MMNRLNIVSPIPPIETVTVLSSGRIIIVILAGLLFGLAFQLLLANLGIAIGLSVFNLRPNSQPADKSSEGTGESSFEVIAIIGIAAGLGIMLSIDGVLFAACFLAVKLSQITDPWLGSVLGGLIWSVYLILLTWLSTSAVGTIADAVLGYTRTGLRRLFGAVSQLFTPETSGSSQPDSASIETARQALFQTIEEMDVTLILENALAELNPKSPSQQAHLSQMIEEVIAQSERNNGIDLDQIIQSLQAQIELPETDLKQLRHQMQALEQDLNDRTLQPDALADLKHFLATADPSDLKPESLETKLVQIETSDSSQPWSGLKNVDVKGLFRTALRRVDLSDWDVQRIWQLLQSTQEKLTGSTQPEQPVNIIQLDVEDYLLHTPVWNLKPEVIDVDFKQVIYDPEADPVLIHQQLTLLNPNQMRLFLQERKDLSSAQQSEIADALDRVRQSVLEQVQPSQELNDACPDTLHQLQQKLESYCRYTSISKLSPAGIAQKLPDLIEEIQIPATVLAQQRPELDIKPLQAILKRRKGLKPNRRKALLAAMTETWQRLLPDPEVSPTLTPSLQKQIGAIIAERLQKAEAESITLEDLKPHLVELMDRPASGLTTLNQYLGQLDWMALAQDLRQEYSLDPQHLDSILTGLQEEWQQVAKVPRRWARRTQHTAQDWQTQLQRYLKYQDRSALTEIESLEQSLRTLVDGIKDGVADSNRKEQSSGTLPQLPHLPKQSDIVAVLEDRKDLTVAEIKKIAGQVTSTWKTVDDEVHPLQEQAQSSLNTVATKVQEILNSISDSTPDPEKLQEKLSQSLPNVEIGPLGESLQSWVQKAPVALLEESSWQQIRDRITHTTQTTYHKLIHTRDDLEDTVKHQLSQQADALQDQLLEQVDQLQTDLQQQATELKRETQRQADKVRQSAAIAAWWLFAIALTSGMTSALSGFLAIRGFR